MSLVSKGNILLFLSLIFLLSCTQKYAGQQKKYSIYVLAKDGREYMVQTNSFTQGMLKPEKDGILLDSKVMDRDVIVKNNFYYHLNRRKPVFEKYESDGKSLQVAGSVPLQDFSVENANWINADTLLLTGLNNKDFTQVKYVLLDAKEMAVVSSGDIAIPHPSGKFTSLSIGLVEVKDHTLMLGYTYNQLLSSSSYTTSDTSYFSVLSYPRMKLQRTAKDTRSTSPGGINTIQSYSFYDEKQNYYFMSCPGIALGNRPDLPTAIFRIRAGEQAPDQSYFFNISGSSIKNHAYGMWYLGANKVIIRNERKDIFKGLSDHYSTAHFEFHVVDLLTRTIKKLDLPLDKGTRRQCVIVENGIAYIAVNSTLQGNYIWMYTIITGELKKGLQLGGDTDFIMRIDKLQD